MRRLAGFQGKRWPDLGDFPLPYPLELPYVPEVLPTVGPMDYPLEGCSKNFFVCCVDGTVAGTLRQGLSGRAPLVLAPQTIMCKEAESFTEEDNSPLHVGIYISLVDLIVCKVTPVILHGVVSLERGPKKFNIGRLTLFQHPIEAGIFRIHLVEC